MSQLSPGDLETNGLPESAREAIASWLRLHAQAQGPVVATRMAGGYSNLTFQLTASGGKAWVLRRPPVGHQGGSAHDVLREAGVLSALQATSVPVPAVVVTFPWG